MRDISCLAEQLTASQEGLNSVVLVARKGFSKYLVAGPVSSIQYTWKCEMIHEVLINP